MMHLRHIPRLLLGFTLLAAVVTCCSACRVYGAPTARQASDTGHSTVPTALTTVSVPTPSVVVPITTPLITMTPTVPATMTTPIQPTPTTSVIPVVRTTPITTAEPVGSPSSTPTVTVSLSTLTPTPSTTANPGGRAAAPLPGWSIRAVDTMKLSRDTLAHPLTDAQIAAVVALDTQLHLTYITVDVYYDDPVYLARWVRAIRTTGVRVWFRPHWYAWESHGNVHGTMTPSEYIEATRHFLQKYSGLFQNGDIFDFCSEPENGTYWLDAYGSGWSWHNPAAKTAFNTFIRSGLYMARTTLANRGRGHVLVSAIGVDESIATRLLSKPTVASLGFLTLDLYPEGTTSSPSTASQRLVQAIAAVHAHWEVPILIGEHGYSRDRQLSDTVQAAVLRAEIAALEQIPYLKGLNYWVDAGGPGYGGYTNLYRLVRGKWTARQAASVLATAYQAMSGHP